MSQFRHAWPVALLVCAGPAFACPGGAETVLSCLVGSGAKQLEVCLTDDNVSYVFGVPGEVAELTLAEPIGTVRHTPWSGVGRSIWESTTFRNGDHAYEVYISVDRLSEDQPSESGVLVWRGEEMLADIKCLPETQVIGLWAMSDAKAAKGLCYRGEDEAWIACD